MAHEAGGLPCVSNEYLPDVFADEALGFELVNGTVRVTFGVVKMAEPAPPAPVQMVVMGRLVIGVEGAQRLAIGLYDYLKNAGHDPQKLVSSGEDAKPH